MIKRRKKVPFERKSIHTPLSYYLGILAVVVQFFVGIPHINDTDPIGARFGTLCVVEGVFALIGLFFIDALRPIGFRIKPKSYEWQKIDKYSGYSFLIAMLLNFMVQIITAVPLTIRDYEMALAIIFAAPCEELFFRGFLMNLFMRGDTTFKGIPKTRIFKAKRDDNTGETRPEKFISPLTASGIIVTAVIFMLFHVNYYGQSNLMTMVFLGGLIYATVFFLWEKLTALILVHLIINVITVYQMFWLVNLL